METYEFQSLSRVGSTSKLAPVWLHKSEQPIRSQISSLTQLLTMTPTPKFSDQEEEEIDFNRLDLSGLTGQHKTLAQQGIHEPIGPTYIFCCL